jgi:hypothetical protein
MHNDTWYTTLGIATLSITTLSITIETQHHAEWQLLCWHDGYDTMQNETQHSARCHLCWVSWHLRHAKDFCTTQRTLAGFQKFIKIFLRLFLELWCHIMQTLVTLSLLLKMEARALKNAIICFDTNIQSYLKTSVGQSSNLYSNVVHVFNTSVN